MDLMIHSIEEGLLTTSARKHDTNEKRQFSKNGTVDPRTEEKRDGR